MPARSLSVRKIRDVLRLLWCCGLSVRQAPPGGRRRHDSPVRRCCVDGDANREEEENPASISAHCYLPQGLWDAGQCNWISMTARIGGSARTEPRFERNSFTRVTATSKAFMGMIPERIEPWIPRVG